MGQLETVKSMLLGGSLDSVEAEKVGVMNLSSFISRLRKSGHNITKAYKCRPNSDKTRIVNVAEYVYRY